MQALSCILSVVFTCTRAQQFISIDNLLDLGNFHYLTAIHLLQGKVALMAVQNVFISVDAAGWPLASGVTSDVKPWRRWPRPTKPGPLSMCTRIWHLKWQEHRLVLFPLGRPEPKHGIPLRKSVPQRGTEIDIDREVSADNVVRREYIPS